MSRVKRGVTAHARHKKILALAKGFRLDELTRQLEEAEHECSHATC
mgnify:CR=1 FL=1